MIVNETAAIRKRYQLFQMKAGGVTPTLRTGNVSVGSPNLITGDQEKDYNKEQIRSASQNISGTV